MKRLCFHRSLLQAFSLLVLLDFFTSCRKDPLPLPVFRELTLPLTEDITSVWFTDSLHGTATAGTPWLSGVLLSTADGGRSWSIDTLLDSRLECVCFDAAGRGYACGQAGRLLWRSAPGAAWQNLRMDYGWSRACHFWDEKRGVAVSGEGFQNGAARRYGPPAPWQLDTTNTFPNALSGVWYSDSATAHAVGLGWVLRSDDGGRHWARLDVTGDFFRAVHFPSPATGYICGLSGTVLKTTDGGHHWQKIRDGGSVGGKNKPFRSLWFVSDEKGYLAGDDGLLWRTENGGSDWTPLAGLPSDVDAADIFVLGNRGWIAADGGRMFYFETE